NLIQFVRSFIISAACPFSIGENQHIRHCLVKRRTGFNRSVSTTRG
ncbi:unnamed protein product, partial [Ascophyllum nodosum]